ncbi:MAG: hypothetical protein U0X86_000059 [Wolbachia endosymbiont of Xenopsylla cheopis]
MVIWKKYIGKIGKKNETPSVGIIAQKGDHDAGKKVSYCCGYLIITPIVQRPSLTSKNNIFFYAY